MSRAYCYQCHKARPACICGQLPEIDNRINITILQHPAETRNPKGSAIIAKLYLQKIQLWTGEDFSAHPQLNQLIEQHPNSTAIVYPGDNSISLDKFHSYITSSDPGKPSDNQLNLIFIDGNWRKAKKIWHLSSNLHKLPCIHINPETRSNYRIRKIPADDLLSTIEAIHYCLNYLEKEEQKYQPLLDIFNKMIDFQIHKMGKDVFQNNYQ